MKTGHLRVPVDQFAAARDAIRTEVEARGYNERLGTYVSVLDGDEVDASLLVLALHGYADSNGSRMQSTCRRIRERLGVDSLLYRYVEDDGLPPGEGAFGICGFWEVECRAMRGDHSAAVRQFENLLRYGNDVGLFAEETDPATGAALGNFPQGLTHVGSDQRRAIAAGAPGMNLPSILLWGFAATVALTTMMSVSHGIGLTRISIPFLLGTMLTPNRDRALVVGVAFHVVNGWLFAFVYAALLEGMDRATWWLGAGIGLVHALFVLAVGMPLLPGLHPRMVSEYLRPNAQSSIAAAWVFCPELRQADADRHHRSACAVWRHHRRILRTGHTVRPGR